MEDSKHYIIKHWVADSKHYSWVSSSITLRYILSSITTLQSESVTRVSASVSFMGRVGIWSTLPSLPTLAFCSLLLCVWLFWLGKSWLKVLNYFHHKEIFFVLAFWIQSKWDLPCSRIPCLGPAFNQRLVIISSLACFLIAFSPARKFDESS